MRGICADVSIVSFAAMQLLFFGLVFYSLVLCQSFPVGRFEDVCNVNLAHRAADCSNVDLQRVFGIDRFKNQIVAIILSPCFPGNERIAEDSFPHLESLEFTDEVCKVIPSSALPTSALPSSVFPTSQPKPSVDLVSWWDKVEVFFYVSIGVVFVVAKLCVICCYCISKDPEGDESVSTPSSDPRPSKIRPFWHRCRLRTTPYGLSASLRRMKLLV